MGLMKKVYWKEMKKWYLNNIGMVFDKYKFIDLFQAS